MSLVCLRAFEAFGFDRLLIVGKPLRRLKKVAFSQLHYFDAHMYVLGMAKRRCSSVLLVGSAPLTMASACSTADTPSPEACIHVQVLGPCDGLAFLQPSITVRYRTWVEHRNDTLLHAQTGVGRLEMSVELTDRPPVYSHSLFQDIRQRLAQCHAPPGTFIYDWEGFLDSAALDAITQVLSVQSPDHLPWVIRVGPPTLTTSAAANAQWSRHQTSTPMVSDVVTADGKDPEWLGWKDGPGSSK